MNSKIHYKTVLERLMNIPDEKLAADSLKAENEKEFIEWQSAGRRNLYRILGMEEIKKLFDTENFSVSAAELSCERISAGGCRESIIRKDIILNCSDGLDIPVYILEPEQKKNQDVFICLPGHNGGGRLSIAGRSDIAAVDEMIRKYNYDYGRQIAEAGYTAVCPDCAGFGQRKEISAADNEDILKGSCKNISNMLLPFGISLAGLFVRDIIKLVDYLKSSKEYGDSRICCMGFSGGGMQALFASAVEERIDSLIVGGYMYGSRDALMVMNDNCPCNYVPELWKHYDMGDIAAMSAPKTMIIQSCSEDVHNGSRGMSNVYEQVRIAERAYELLKSREKLVHDVFPGPHKWHGENIDMYIKKIIGED